MNLSDYINLTITEIADGTKKANATLKEMGNGGIIANGTNFNLEGQRNMCLINNKKGRGLPCLCFFILQPFSILFDLAEGRVE